jgi:hypothetical protein
MAAARLTFEEYLDRVLGGWNGKCIGGTVGARCEAYKGLMEYDFERLKPSEIIPNDDLDVSVMWLHTMEQKGIHLSSEDLAEAWMRHCFFAMNEFGFFKQSMRRGLGPPLSGRFNNRYFRESGGAPMRPELWAFISPGNPELAAAYAGQDGRIDHDDDAVLIEQLYAAVQAAAFVEPTLERALERGLTIVPPDSKPGRCVAYARELQARHGDWRDARRLMLRRFGHVDPTRAVINLGFVTLGLLYGRGDFGETQIVTHNMGYDTDTTCATVGAIFGVLHGDRAIPAEWKAIISGEYTTYVDLPRSRKLVDLARETCRAGVTVAEALNRQIEIVDVPPDLGRLPTAPPERPATIEVAYPERVALGVGESTRVELTVRHGRAEPFAGALHVTAPEPLSVTPTATRLRFDGPGAATVALTVAVPPDVTRLPDANLLRATLSGTGLADLTTTFGVVGALPLAVLGPFWDPFDRSQPERPSIENHYLPKPEFYAGFADLEHPYLNEERLADGAALDDPALRRDEPLDPPGLVYFRENYLTLEDVFGYEGSAIFYLVWDFECPSDREARLAAAGRDPHKLWLNGQLVATQSGFKGWAPTASRRPVQLRQGRNRMVAKLFRLENATKFSFHLRYPREPQYGLEMDNIMTDLVSLVPRAEA